MLGRRRSASSIATVAMAHVSQLPCRRRTICGEYTALIRGGQVSRPAGIHRDGSLHNGRSIRRVGRAFLPVVSGRTGMSHPPSCCWTGGETAPRLVYVRQRMLPKGDRGRVWFWTAQGERAWWRATFKISRNSASGVRTAWLGMPCADGRRAGRCRPASGHAQGQAVRTPEAEFLEILNVTRPSGTLPLCGLAPNTSPVAFWQHPLTDVNKARRRLTPLPLKNLVRGTFLSDRTRRAGMPVLPRIDRPLCRLPSRWMPAGRETCPPRIGAVYSPQIVRRRHGNCETCAIATVAMLLADLRRSSKTVILEQEC